MKPLDWESTIIAGVIGAILFVVIAFFFSMFLSDDDNSVLPMALAGFVIGAGVQTGVRLTGVS